MFEALQIRYEEHRLFHRTNAIIDKLDESFLEVETDWHNNGAIGLWCSTFPKMCSAFGQNCYEVNLKESARRVGWDFGQFVKFCRAKDGRDSYRDLREHCLTSGIDVIYLVEWRPTINEVIIVNYKSVESINLVDCPEDKTYKLSTNSEAKWLGI